MINLNGFKNVKSCKVAKTKINLNHPSIVNGINFKNINSYKPNTTKMDSNTENGFELNNYKIVPDDFVGPLMPGQIREGEYGPNYQNAVSSYLEHFSRWLKDRVRYDMPNIILNSHFSDYNGYDVSQLGYSSANVINGFEVSEGIEGKTKYVINFEDGKQVWFDPITKKPKILIDQGNNIWMDFDYDISEEEREDISKAYIGENKLGDAPIDCIINVHIRGHNIKFASINGGNNYTAMILANKLSRVFEQFYTEEMLTLLEKYFSYSLVSPWENATSPDDKNSAAAYEWGTQEVGYHVFYPTTQFYYGEYYGYLVPIHEMGHVFERIFKHEGKFDLNVWNNYYEKYKKIIVGLKGITGYSKANGYKEPPNEREFFAEATVLYYTNVGELIRYMPEVYSFLNILYKKYDAYIVPGISKYLED